MLARKPSIRIRLIVPNPDNTEIMKELARRFGAASEQVLADKIKAAIEEFKNIFLNANNHKVRLHSMGS